MKIFRKKIIFAAVVIICLASMKIKAEAWNEEIFNCSLQVKYLQNQKKVYIDIKDQQIKMMLQDNKTDLQPVFNSEEINKVFYTPVRFMGNLYEDPETKKLKFLMGIYHMRISYNINSKNDNQYWTPESGDRYSAYYAHPVSENVSSYLPHMESEISMKINVGAHANANDISFKCEHVGSSR